MTGVSKKSLTCLRFILFLFCFVFSLRYFIDAPNIHGDMVIREHYTYGKTLICVGIHTQLESMFEQTCNRILKCTF